MTRPCSSSDEIAHLGEAVFKRDIAERLRGRDLRDFVAIEVESGDYEVDADEGVAIRRLQERHPKSVFWIRRVGSSVSRTMGGMLQFEPPWGKRNGPRYTRGEVAALGEAVFKREIAEQLRGRDLRDYVAIAVDSGAYEVDADSGLAIHRLLDRRPGEQFWLRRVGSRVANSFGPRLHFEAPWEP